MEKVSIIIPIYNGEKYLKETIDSCVNQTYGEVEIILVNDASSDNSETIALEYVNSNSVIYISNKKNVGMMKSCNKGIAQATGNKVIVLGQDDILPSKHVETVMAYFEENISFVVSNPQRMDENGKLGELIYKENEFESIMRNLPFMLAQNNVIPSTGLIMDKDKMLYWGGYDETYRNYGEWLLWIRLMAIGEVGVCLDSHPYYRTHTNNLTSTFNNKKNQCKNIELQKFWLTCQKEAISKLEFSIRQRIFLVARYCYKKLIFTKSKLLYNSGKKDEK